MRVIKPNELSFTDGSFVRNSVASYFDSLGAMQTVSANIPRFNYNPSTHVFEGILIENAATNLLLNSTTLSTQSVTVTNTTAYVLSFYGTGSVTLSGAATGTFASAGAYPARKIITINTATTSLTITVTGSVQYAQLELGSVPTSWIPTTSAAVTRNADVVTGSNLIYTTVTELWPLWNSATNYQASTPTTPVKVRYLGNIYESLAGSNTNKIPPDNPTHWLLISADNAHAAFDTVVGTSTTATTELTFVVRPGVIDSAALINLEGALVEIAGYDTSSNVIFYKANAGLSGANVTDWYQYFFFDPLIKRTQVVFYGIPSYNQGLITIRIKNTTGSAVSVAQAVFGTVAEIGGTQYSPNASIVDYSVKETDAFGNIRFVERAYSKRMSAEVFVSNAQLNRVYNLLANIRAKPSVWIGSDDPRFEEPLVIYGFYRDFGITISYPAHSMCNLEIEGLT